MYAPEDGTPVLRRRGVVSKFGQGGAANIRLAMSLSEFRHLANFWNESCPLKWGSGSALLN